ncbi:MAG: hypothetical protein LAO51_18835 [Acidobacteriia bacterium]|nr:hypothetical protein [Terriglobia bacterium]
MRLMVVDVVALDEQGHTVPGLAREDFEIEVDGKSHEADTLDATCGAEQADLPGGTATTASVEPPPRGAPPPRRVVIAISFVGVRGACRSESDMDPCVALDRLKREFRKRSRLNEDEYLVVSIGRTVRVEQPFTHNPADVVRTIDRMEDDLTLWDGSASYGGDALLNGLDALLDSLGRVPGSKVLVLYNNGPGPCPATNEARYDGIAARAAASRTAIYPMDVSGYLLNSCPGAVEAHGLTRLAEMTGGRVTAKTWNHTLALARAEHDLDCRYSVGFYDRDAVLGRDRALTVKVRRPGLRVLHPSAYVFRSEDAERKDLLRAAHQLPDLFQGGLVRTHVFPLRPSGRKRWDCLVVVDFPVDLSGSGDAAIRDFGVTVRGRAAGVFRFDRRVTLRAREGAGAGERRVSFMDRATLGPGEYEIDAVLVDPDGRVPSAVRETVRVPEVPISRPFLVGPYLGNPAGRDVVIQSPSAARAADGALASDLRGDYIGGSTSFEPLLVQRLQNAQSEVAVLTLACGLERRRRAEGRVVRRALLDEDGADVGSLSPVPLAGFDEGESGCRTLLDRIPARGLRPGRYLFEAAIEPAPDPDTARSSVRFTVPSPPDPPASTGPP